MKKILMDKSNLCEVVILLVGNKGVGKTSVLQCFLHRTPVSPESLSHSLGDRTLPEQSSDRAVQTWLHAMQDGDKLINVTLWDPVECNSLLDINAYYYAHADAIIIMFDCKDRSSYSAVASWNAYARNRAGNKCLTFILGINYNATDCTPKPRELREHSRILGVMKTFLLVTMTHSNVDSIFRSIIRLVISCKKSAQRQLVGLTPGETDFLSSRTGYGNFVRSVVDCLYSWVHPHFVVNSDNQQLIQNKTYCEEISPPPDQGHTGETHIPEASSRSDYETPSTSLQSVSPDLHGMDENVIITRPSTSSSIFEPLDIQPHTYPSISSNGASVPVPSSTREQAFSETPEVTTITVEAEVYNYP